MKLEEPNMIEQNMAREKVDLQIMLDELHKYETKTTCLSDEEIDRSSELLQRVRINSEFIAIQQRKAEKKRLKKQPKRLLWRKRDLRSLQKL